ncbi:MAG: dienelactone hydrolase family protein [Candidatus Omnitrophica bacterium]|nr:dienelactone hydrolase family protein [Candidatus Omnitrophota bacterium]
MVGKNLGQTEANVQIGAWGLEGIITLPQANTTRIVLFAHGSGSSRLSPRNRFVAEVLNRGGFGTLLMDLLTPEEEQEEAFTGRLRFNIQLLSERLTEATNWLVDYSRATLQLGSNLSIGYFGASTGAAAALLAASERPELVKAIVSRGGRPDLAGESLARVKAPTLLIVGGNDFSVVPLNELALEKMSIEQKTLVIVPNATHLFEEHGALEQVATLAQNWFKMYLK